MKNLNKLWRICFAVAMGALAIQQLIYGGFRPVILPPSFPSWLPERLVWTWLFSLLLLAASAAIILKIKARSVSITIGSILLLFVVAFHVPFQLGSGPLHLGAWTDALKALALSGGAFIVAESLPKRADTSTYIMVLQNLAPCGKYFLAILMIGFGIDHFLYTGFISTFVPNWIPGHVFWTYLAAVCLIASGIAIILNLYRRTATTLLGIMMFSWFFLLHLPRAIADPYTGDGNEWTSVFEVIAFGASAFLIDRATGKDRGASKKVNETD